MTTLPSIKTAASLIQAYLKEVPNPTYAQLLELAAKTRGYRDYATAKALDSKLKVELTLQGTQTGRISATVENKSNFPSATEVVTCHHFVELVDILGECMCDSISIFEIGGVHYHITEIHSILHHISQVNSVYKSQLSLPAISLGSDKGDTLVLLVSDILKIKQELNADKWTTEFKVKLNNGSIGKFYFDNSYYAIRMHVNSTGKMQYQVNMPVKSMELLTVPLYCYDLENAYETMMRLFQAYAHQNQTTNNFISIEEI